MVTHTYLAYIGEQPSPDHVPKTNENRDGKKYSNRDNIVVLQTHFSVNLDDVYAGPKGPFYVLTKIDVKRRNVFQLSSVLYFIDGTKSEEFFSKPFRIRTRSEAAITKSVSSPIPSPEFRNTHIGVHTLVSDRVFASSVTMDNIMSTISLDLGAAKVLLFY